VNRLELSDVERQVLGVLRRHEWRELRFFKAELSALEEKGLVRVRKGESLWKAKLTDPGERERLWLALIRKRPDLENAVMDWPEDVAEARLVFHRETISVSDEQHQRVLQRLRTAVKES